MSILTWEVTNKMKSSLKSLKPLLGAALLLQVLCVCTAAEKRTSLQVKAVGYRVIPHERTTYYRTQGYSNTSCYGSGTYFGSTVSATADCSTVSTPPQVQPITIRSVEIYNQVEADGQVYTIRCIANWVGSNCSWLTPGDVFPAEIEGRTMWIVGRKGGNLGKEARGKHQLLDMRPTPVIADTVSQVTVAPPVIPIPNPPYVPESPRPGSTTSPKAETSSSVPQKIVVRFTSIPSNAEVNVDGNYWGSTPTADLARLPAGMHTIVVRKLGYKPWERKIDLAAGDDRTVNAELEVDPTKPRVSGLN